MLLCRASASLLFAAFFAASGLAQDPPSRSPVAPEDIVKALRLAGMNVDASIINVPTSIAASMAHPALHIDSVALSNQKDLQLRLSCELPARCLPFFATAELPNREQASAAQHLLQARNETGRRSSSLTSAAIHAGERATLLFADTHMTISLPVISIDSGPVGSEVRVASLDRKQVYRGTVTDTTTVRGIIP